MADFTKEDYVKALNNVCDRAGTIEDAKELYAESYHNRKPSDVSEEDFEKYAPDINAPSSELSIIVRIMHAMSAPLVTYFFSFGLL